MTQSKFSTDDRQRGSFHAHGLVESEVDGRLLRNVAYGPFNEELFEAYAAVHVPLANAMAAVGEPWVDLYLIRDNALATAQTMVDYTNYLIETKAAGRAAIATAFVLSNEVEGADIMRPLYLQCFAEAGLAARLPGECVRPLGHRSTSQRRAHSRAGCKPMAPRQRSCSSDSTRSTPVARA